MDADRAVAESLQGQRKLIRDIPRGIRPQPRVTGGLAEGNVAHITPRSTAVGPLSRYLTAREFGGLDAGTERLAGTRNLGPAELGLLARQTSDALPPSPFATPLQGLQHLLQPSYNLRETSGLRGALCSRTDLSSLEERIAALNQISRSAATPPYPSSLTAALAQRNQTNVLPTLGDRNSTPLNSLHPDLNEWLAHENLDIAIALEREALLGRAAREAGEEAGMAQAALYSSERVSSQPPVQVVETRQQSLHKPGSKERISETLEREALSHKRQNDASPFSSISSVSKAKRARLDSPPTPDAEKRGHSSPKNWPKPGIPQFQRTKEKRKGDTSNTQGAGTGAGDTSPSSKPKRKPPISPRKPQTPDQDQPVRFFDDGVEVDIQGNPLGSDRAEDAQSEQKPDTKKPTPQSNPKETKKRSEEEKTDEAQPECDEKADDASDSTDDQEELDRLQAYQKTIWDAFVCTDDGRKKKKKKRDRRKKSKQKQATKRSSKPTANKTKYKAVAETQKNSPSGHAENAPVVAPASDPKKAAAAAAATEDQEGRDSNSREKTLDAASALMGFMSSNPRTKDQHS